MRRVPAVLHAGRVTNGLSDVGVSKDVINSEPKCKNRFEYVERVRTEEITCLHRGHFVDSR
jgi:hypothetical protein